MGCTLQCAGMKKIFLGLLVLANHYWDFWEWGFFIGVLLVVVGAMMFAMPACPCASKAAAQEPAPKKKKR